MDINSKLCNNCPSSLENFDEKIDHHPDGKSLLKSAEAGCPLCAVLSDGFQQLIISKNSSVKFDELTSFKYQLRKSGLVGEEAGLLLFEFSASPKPTTPVENAGFVPFSLTSLLRGTDFLMVFYVIPVPNANTLPGAQKLAKNTNNEQSWKIATHWLQQCIESHPRCNRRRNQTWLPARVLDVGIADKPGLHLHIASPKSPYFPYATLSHCWGKIQIQQLRTDNFDQMCNGIDLNTLPKTFQDAISITRKLGLRYLWIDSLCIIQDSVSDWAKESSTMGEVYANGICNIAATAAPDGRLGCFLDRNPLLAQKYRVRIGKETVDLIDQMCWYNNITDAPLNKRAWVLQEELLSPRILHWGKQQLFWRCTELTASESYPDGFPCNFGESKVSIVDWLELNRPRQKNHQAANQLLQKQPDSWWPAYDFWLNLVGSYTRRSLTKEQDKLVAVSALAKEISSVMKGKYLAGLWGNTYFPFQLLWTHLAPPEARKPGKTKAYCAPSWSWASLDARIVSISPNTVDHFGGLFMVRILDISLDYLTEDIFGPVTGGNIKLRGWLKCLKFFDIGRLDPWCWNLNIEWSKELGFIYPDEDIRSSSLANLYVLPIATLQYGASSGATDNNAQVRGLLLAATGEKYQYRRVGTFRTRWQFTYLFNVPLYQPAWFLCSICGEQIPDIDGHYHCSICDDDDFDLCQACVDKGIRCRSEDHWLIKRIVKNRQGINTTEKISSATAQLSSEPKVTAVITENLEVPVPTSADDQKHGSVEVLGQDLENLEISDENDEQQCSDRQSDEVDNEYSEDNTEDVSQQDSEDESEEVEDSDFVYEAERAPPTYSYRGVSGLTYEEQGDIIREDEFKAFGWTESLFIII